MMPSRNEGVIMVEILLSCFTISVKQIEKYIWEIVIQDITWGKIFCGKKEKDIHDEAKPKESSQGEGTKHMKFTGI